MSCPSADALSAFAAGGLDASASAAIESHIDTCDACRSALSSAVRGAAPEPRFGRYRVDTVLGAGGMGLVYRAFDPELSRSVAIKVVRARDDEAATDGSERTRLAREARSLARLSHPNVCHVYDVGEHEGEVWVAMELVDGVDLRQWSLGRDSASIQRVLLDAARGISAAHDAGLVHRDVKPQNVLVTRDGRAVVTDFGLARSDDRATTSAAAEAAGVVRITGTPAYLAPEQLTGAVLDARVDQFAWAVMAWELLTGERPFPIEPAARLSAIRAGLSVPRGLAPAVGAALTRALSAAPRDRFASMADVIAAIESAPVAGVAARGDEAPARSDAGAGSRAWIPIVALLGIAIAIAVSAIVLMGDPRPSEVQSVAGAHDGDANAGQGTGNREPTEEEKEEEATGNRQQATGNRQPTEGETGNGQQGTGNGQQGTGNRQPGTGNRERGEGETGNGQQGTGNRQPGTGNRERGEGETGNGQRATGNGQSETAVVALGSETGSGSGSDTGTGSGSGSGSAPVASSHFDRARAERRLSDCRFPVDPANPDPLLSKLGQGVIDWGPVIRRESVIGVGKDGEHTMLMYEIAGARRRYRFDGDAFASRLGTLEAAVGDIVVVCPFALPAVAEVDHRELPPGWRAPSPPIYAFAPTTTTPAVSTTLANLSPLHVPDSTLRTPTSIPSGRNLLVFATPRKATDGLWDMGGWLLDPSDLPADSAALLAANRSLWLVVARPTVTDGRATLHGVVALRRILD